MIKYDAHETFSHILTPEGAHIALHGSHEARVWAALPIRGQGNPVAPTDLKRIVGGDTAKVGQGRAFKNGWIAKEGDGLVKIVRHSSPPSILCLTLCNPLTDPKTSSIDDTTQHDLHEIDSTGSLRQGEKVLADLRKRKLVTQRFATAFPHNLAI